MTARMARIARGTGSAATILLLTVGVPLLLARLVGWPLPTKVPSASEVSLATRSGIADTTIAKAIALIAWIAWLQVTAAVVAEAAAVAKRGRTVRLPLLPGVQQFATRLVTGALLMSTALQPARALAAPIPIPVSHTAPAIVTDVPARVTPPVDAGTVTTDQSAAGPIPTPTQPTITVRRHDSYWAIAERTLSDGLRWREIHRLNVGRTLPDGSVITADDDTLHRGWQLFLPTDAHVPDVDIPAVAAAATSGHHVIERGDNLWDIAEATVETGLGRDASAAEIAPTWAEIIELNRDIYVEPGNPNLVYPGQIVRLTRDSSTGEPPATNAPTDENPADEEPTAGTPIAGPAPSATTPSATSAPPTTDPSTEVPTTTAAATSTSATIDTPAPSVTGRPEDILDGSAARTDDDGSDAVAIAVGGLSSIALAVGLRRLITRRRRRSVAIDGPGTPPDETNRRLHQLVVAQADEERLVDLRSILAGLAASFAASGSARRPRIVRHEAGTVEVLLDQPDPHPPAGWSASSDGLVWTFGDTQDIPPAEGCAAPLLVTIGEPEDDAHLYLDLETDALWALTGDASVACDLARSMLTELTLTPLADTLRVIAVGDLTTDDVPLEHLTVVPTWDDIDDDFRSWADASHDALIEANWDNAFLARGVDPDNDVLAPLVVIADHPPSDDLTDHLLHACPGSFAVVAVGAFDGAQTIRCAVDELHIPIADISCEPQRLTHDELSDIAVLIAEPDERAVLEPLLAVSDGNTSAEQLPLETEPAPDAVPAEPPDYDILVRLLGDITVEGGKSLKPKATSVVAYLAVHRSVSTERLEEACWFGADGVSHRKRLRDTMTESRDAIGSQHLPPNRGGTYNAGSGLRTDLDLFDWHVDQASRTSAHVALGHYEAALDLVRGKPFSYANAARASFGWVDFEHHATTWEHRIAGVAHAASAVLVDAGRHDDAIVLLRRVVRAIPLTSSVVESLIRSHLAAGDDRGAQAVYSEHAAALDQAGLGEPADSVEALFAA